jgi:DNA replication protein
MDHALRGRYEMGIVQALSAGFVSVPGALLKHYKRLKLTELDVMLLLHLHYFQEREHNYFPTWEDLGARMAASPEQIAASLQRMLKQGILQIDEEIDAESGVRSERYNLSPIYARLAEVMEPEANAAAGRTAHGTAAEESAARAGRSAVSVPAAASPAEAGLFNVFEHEFGRPLSPMECETIAGWLDQDRYSEDLIRLALKEAVFAGKVNFRYIDRILLEWSRNRVTTPQQAKAYAQRFRGGR